MSVNPISNPDPSQANQTQTNLLQIRKGFDQIGQALQSGDLNAAQNAFASLQQLLPNSATNQAQTAQQTNQNTFTADLNAVGQALKSGDLSKAQDAFAKLQQDMQAAQKGHHHYHHHKADNSQGSTSSVTGLGTSTVSDSGSESGTNIFA